MVNTPITIWIYPFEQIRLFSINVANAYLEYWFSWLKWHFRLKDMSLHKSQFFHIDGNSKAIHQVIETKNMQKQRERETESY